MAETRATLTTREIIAPVEFFHFCRSIGTISRMKSETIKIDKAGRVGLPKLLREQFNLGPGDELRLSVEGNSIKLEPTDTRGRLVREGSVLVFSGQFAEPITTSEVERLIEEDRENRFADATGKLRKK